MEFNSNFILGCSAIGAGLAVIAGRKKSGSKIRYYIYHASWTGSCRDNRSVWSVGCYASVIR